MGPSLGRLVWKLAALKVPVVAHPRRKAGHLEAVDAYVKTIDVRDIRSAIAGRARRKVSESGGFSILHNGMEPTDGFMVALPHAELAVPKAQLTKGKLAGYMEEHAEELARDDTYFGGWLDKETDRVFLDISRRFDSMDDAHAQGSEWNQLAIWDVAKGEEIRLANEEQAQQGAKKVYLPKDDPDAAWDELQKLFGDDDAEAE